MKCASLFPVVILMVLAACQDTPTAVPIEEPIVLMGESAQPKVSICHYERDVDRWNLIVVAAPGADSHLANHQRDGKPGGTVPGMPGHLFDKNCTPEPLPPWCDVTLDFDGGMLPSGWAEALIRGGPGLTNDRVEARPTDSGAWIYAVGAAPTFLTELVVEYDGLNLSQFFGMSRRLRLQSGTEYVVLIEQSARNDGRVWLYTLNGSGAWPIDNETTTELDKFPFQYGEHHIKQVITDGQVEWTVFEADGTVAVQHTQSIPGLVLSEIRGFYWMVYTTTPQATWGDNLNISCR